MRGDVDQLQADLPPLLRLNDQLKRVVSPRNEIPDDHQTRSVQAIADVHSCLEVIALGESDPISRYHPVPIQAGDFGSPQDNGGVGFRDLLDVVIGRSRIWRAKIAKIAKIVEIVERWNSKATPSTLKNYNISHTIYTILATPTSPG